MKKLILIALLGLTLVSATPTKLDDEFMERYSKRINEKSLPHEYKGYTLISMSYDKSTHTLSSEGYLNIDDGINTAVSKKNGKKKLLASVKSGMLKKALREKAVYGTCEDIDLSAAPKGIEFKINYNL